MKGKERVIDVVTSIEPPPPHTAPFGEESDVDVDIWITETDGTRRKAMASITVTEPTDEQLVDVLLACLRGVATMRDPSLAAAVDRRIR